MVRLLGEEGAPTRVVRFDRVDLFVIVRASVGRMTVEAVGMESSGWLNLRGARSASVGLSVWLLLPLFWYCARSRPA